MAQRPLFPHGRILATPGALDALEEAGQGVMDFLIRHVHGDWGNVGDEDKEANDRALIFDSRIFSAYTTANDQTIWVITEADRSATTFLLPEEY